jgi:DNA-binding NarL/FixJ family response regulator
MRRARVLLVDDHATVAEQLRRLLEGEFDIVATVSDGYGMIGAAEVLKPDIIVSDIAMPGMDGIAAAGWVLKSNPAARIVFVTVHREPEIMKRAMDIGAMGYVLKLSAGEELVPALEGVLRGEKYASALNDSANGH